VSELAALQGDFQQYLLRGDAAIEARVTGSPRVPATARLAIYGGAYRGRLAEALGANYPALARLLDEDFADLAQAYVAGHDSPYFSIRYYGEDLARFLATEERYAGAPLLADLARWEWAMTQVFDAADATALDAAALSQVAPDAWALLRFRWHPSLARLDLQWNAPQVWQALTEERERPAAAVSAAATPWLLWRQGLTTYFRSLTPAEAQALDAARSGAPFGELCELLCETVGDEAAPVTAATFLRSWVASGLIIAAD
jgi:Putative DNA-binding domain